ncbi:MAG TPA: glycoside hydrolase family 172 protein, partial [Candidatus Methylacidiphilales bacterium]|nr:glycoside hydrolase family 172 protein [Candidatus Methylacidiphilales bacterium]
MKPYLIPSCAVIVCVLTCASASAETYTYPQLVDRLTNLHALAQLPAPGEKTCLASSFDRHSQYDAATDKYINWSANADGTGIIRQEGNESVLMDVQGPGCIWRTWSATASNGHVKIYLDGSATPAVDLPFVGYFNGKTAPFNRPNLVYIPSPAAHGFDNYTPIPFAKSCKIVADKGWGQYYQFTYTLFPAGTVVPTFSMNLSADDAAALDRADKILGQCGQNPVPAAPLSHTESTPLTVNAGKSATVADLTGAGAITALKVKLDLPTDPEAQRNLLRQLTISITWDGDTAPAVWSPLGDFFAYVGGADQFQSLPVGLLPGGTFYSYWYMPYGKGAHIEVGNDGPAPVAMTWEVTHEPLAAPIATLARFHAKWHRDAFLPTRPDRAPDWTLLTTQGTGRYVGTHLHGWNPRGGWWGEGDDKFFIDGEKFPSTFGTGSEDYFGYAWSSAGHFSRPYHNQILNENNEGHFDDNRWHISDSVPFQSGMEADIEKYFPNSKGTLYAAETFWYLNAGGTDPYPPVPVADRLGYWVRPPMYQEPGAIEGESLKQISPAVPETQVRNTLQLNDSYSGGHVLEWWPRPQDKLLELALPVAKAGRYHFIIRCDKSMRRSDGIVQVLLDGKPIGPQITIAGKKLWTPGDPDDLGIVDL